MKNIDLRLAYQRETGHSLATINHMAENADPDYVEWLEEIASVIVFLDMANEALNNILMR